MNGIFEELMNNNRKLTESTDARVNKKSPNKSSKISVSKIKLESRRIFEEEDFDELDRQFAVDPEDSEKDEVVLVIDPEIPADEEVPEDAAEEMIGDLVYKCPVCGANYVCDCDAEKNESLEVDENGVPVECPVCGDDADQILIGEIAPVDNAGEETEMEPISPDDAEEDTEEAEEDFDDLDDEDGEIMEDSLKRVRKTESKSPHRKSRSRKTESK